MRRIYTALLCLGILLPLSLAGASKDMPLTSGDYQYELTAEGMAVITHWLGSSAQPEIPGMLDGHAVTHIGENAFRDSGMLVRARIPDGVESIGDMAFYGCTALVDLTLPLSLREIGDLAFAYCASLESVTVLEGVERIGESAFGDCPKLWMVILPASVTEIGSDAFFGMEAGLLSGIYGYEGSYAQAYAQANGITFFPLTQNSGPSAEQPPETPAEERPPSPEPVSEDEPPAEEAGGDMVTAEIAETAPDPSLYQTLKVGDKNDDVKKMRDRLYELGYYKKRYDHGNFTQSTVDIVAEFQKANGLPVTGVATPETQSLMFSGKAIPKP